MKKFYLVLFTHLILILVSKAQYVTIPDTNFVNWLNTNYPMCMSGNQMDTTCYEIVNEGSIWNLQGQFIPNLDGIQYFSSLTHLNCNSASIDTIPSLPNSLVSVWFNNMNLSSIPNLPQTLKYLRCYGNHIQQLPSLPTSLIELECSNNSLTNLPQLPSSLSRLDCSSNQLSSLPYLLLGLNYLECSNNNISSISSLPSSLVELSCGANELVSLPTLPNNLKKLSCFNNQLTSLPVLPNSITEIYCQKNPLSVLPPLPSSLEFLYCSEDSLTSLPLLPTTLINLYCQQNQLLSMPSLPDSIETLWCWQNQLSTIDTLPASLWTFDASSNNITCFKNIPEDCAIYIQNNSFTCLPNYTNRMLTGYNMSNLLAYPLCVENDTIYNANGCSSIKGIYGFTYIDNNSNCVKEPNESIAKNIPVKLFDSNNNFISSYTTLSSGIYNFELPTDTYLIFVDTANEFFSSTCNNPNLTTVTNDSSSLVSKNFDIECKPGFDIGVQSITRFGWVFPGQQHQLNILAGDLSQWYGLNCADNEGGSIQITINGNVNFDSSIIGTLAPSNIMNNVLTYNVNNFSPSSGILDIGLNLTCDTSSQVGDSISIDVLVLTNGTDNNYSNNSKHYCYPIVNSYDPNNKEVYPPNYLLGTSDWLTYTIHFQNTGTAPAFNIRILDSLNSNLDLSTFEIINYSHANTYTLKDDVINFQFSQIMLVDSATNNELSKGFVQYKIKPKANSEVGTSITNTAYIYFDYNSAIVTNTTLSKIIDLVSSTSEPLSTSKVKIYPNPTSGLIYVDLGGVEHSSITIYNSSGQQVYETVMNETFYSIKIPGAPGIYLMNIQNSQVSLWNKLIKN